MFGIPLRLTLEPRTTCDIKIEMVQSLFNFKVEDLKLGVEKCSKMLDRKCCDQHLIVQGFAIDPECLANALAVGKWPLFIFQ